jgi:FtsZ-binding cell division protein ZapB
MAGEFLMILYLRLKDRLSQTSGCKDTKTLEDNEQLKAQVAELQKENGQAGNDLETMTAARDALTNENEKLKAEIKNLKTRSSGKRASSRKHRRS